MASTRFVAEIGDDAPLSRLYTRGESGLEEVAVGPASSYYPRGATGMAATACDVLRFARMFLGVGQLDGVRVLEPATVDLMTRNHLPAAFTPIRVGTHVFENTGFGLGFAVSLADLPAAGPFLPLPAGSYWWLGAVQTYMWIDPRHDVVGILMVQSTDLGKYPIQYQFQTGIYRAIAADLNGR